MRVNLHRRPPTPDTPDELNAGLEIISRLDKDMKAALSTLSPKEARFLVDLYYQMQDWRIRQQNQLRTLVESNEPHEAIRLVMRQSTTLEALVRNMLDQYSAREETGMGSWARSVTGIGPVIAAGLCAHLDWPPPATVGHWWSFAGLNPTSEWKKGEKRPWNAGLKVLCYKIGESFVKTQNNPRDIYGKIYVERKAYEQAKNEAGDFAEQAKAKLERFKIGEDTDARKWYGQGKLPPAHIHARARRYSVKLFLSHYHQVAYERHYGKPAPLPYPLAHLAHTHFIPPPA